MIAPRALRYLVVGGLAFLVDFACLMLLAPSLPLLAANTIAFLAANALNFALGHVWVFGQPLGGAAFGRQYGAVFAISVVGLALNDAFVWSGVNVLGLGLAPSKVAATALVMAWNFQARALWVYRKG